MTKKVIWVEKLGIVDIVFLTCLKAFYQISIRYDEHKVSPFAQRLLSILQSLKLCMNFYPAKLSLNVKDSKGYALTYKVEQDFGYCLDEFCNLHVSNEGDWFKQMTRAYIASYLSSRIRFIAMVQSEIEDYDKQINILYIARHPLNSVIIPYYKKKEFTFWTSPGLIENIKFYLRPLYFILTILLTRLFASKVKTNITNIKPAVWVEYTYNDLVNFIFWRPSNQSEEFDIVYYLDRPDTLASEEIIKKIESNGLKWIDAHFLQMIRLSHFNIQQFKELFLTLFSVPSCRPIWFKAFQFESKIWYLLYRSVYMLFRVKVLIQHQETSWKQGVQAKALESVNGIMVGFNWSNFPHHNLPTHLTPQHVYFVWGKAKYTWAQNKGNSCSYILPSGLWILPDKDSSIGLSGFSENIKFVITVFDSSVSYNIYQSPDTLSQFYLMVISLLESNKKWGGIIKSKNYNELQELHHLPSGDEIITKMGALVEHGRLIFLSKLVYPSTAASFADLSICYGLNTAGIIAGIHGYKAIHWDCSGWLNHPFYKEAGQKLLYPSLNEFKKAILKAAAGDDTIGDFSCWRMSFNHYNDYLASERVGEFIEHYMLDVIKTGDAKKSLDFTANRYIEKHKIDNKFFEENDNIRDSNYIERVCSI